MVTFRIFGSQDWKGSLIEMVCKRQRRTTGRMKVPFASMEKLMGEQVWG
jgi:hypothetical protein